MATPVTVPFEQRSYSGGVNAAVLPSSAAMPDELSLIVNGTVRNGYLKTRPGWEWQPLSFLSSESQLLFENGMYQGSEFFMSSVGNVFVYAVDGHLFSFDPMTRTVVKVSDKQAFSKFSPHVWLKQRSRWMIAQDGTSIPVISDGVTITQKLDRTGVPIGTIMAEGWHRLAVVLPDRRRIRISDHELDPVSTPLSFTEETAYFKNARYFEAPPSMGKIMGMTFSPYQDTSTGIGPLLVFCEKGIRAYNIAVPRDQWVTADISQTILPKVGSSSFFAFTDKGSDIIFKDQDGRIRSIRNAQQTEGNDAGFSNDYQIWPLLQNEDPSLRKYSQAANFDKRVLVLTHPFRDYLPDGRFNVSHKGIAVIENETISQKNDVWTFWAGHNICGMDVGPVNGQEMLIAFCRDRDGKNRLYSLTKNGRYDTTNSAAGPVSKRIKMTFAPPVVDFGVPLAQKLFNSGGMRLTGLRGQIDVTGRWQHDGGQLEPWFNHSEIHGNCMMFGSKQGGKCQPMGFIADGSNPRLVFPTLADGSASFFKGRPVFDILGPCQVEEFAMAADIRPTNKMANAKCRPEVKRVFRTVCDLDLDSYDASLIPETQKQSLKPCP